MQLPLVETYLTYLPVKWKPVTLVVENKLPQSEGHKRNHD
jgi:hypothetical protein